MANNEAGLRTELVKAFQKVAFTQTISQRFVAGMPDLLVCWTGDVWFFELKFVMVDHAQPLIRMTDLQRSWMRRYQNEGGNVAWIVCNQVGLLEWSLYAGIDSNQTRCTELDLALTRRRGVPWDVLRLLDFLNQKREERGK